MMGKGRLNLGVGYKKDSLKVTLREAAGDEGLTEKGFEVVPEFSLTLLRSPYVCHADATKTKDGWNFEGSRLPVIIDYEHPVSDKSVVHAAVRIHTMHIIKGGSFAVEVHPSWSMAAGEKFRIGLGADVLIPGMPFPVADEDLAQEIAAEEGSAGYNDVMDRIPQAGAPVFVLPTLGLWWRI